MNKYLLVFMFLFCTLCSIFSFSIENSKQVVGLDVRTIEEVKENPAPGSLHLPIDSLEEKISENLKNKEKEIYVFCESGYRAEKAKALLNKLGFHNVKNYKSWREWNQFNSKK